MLFKYNTVVDVGNVTEYTLTGLQEGKTYYFALTAYDGDKPNNESNFSVELIHTVAFARPGGPGDLKKRDPAPARLSFPEKLNPIKDLTEQKAFNQEGK
jgi:hypothetical protein